MWGLEANIDYDPKTKTVKIEIPITYTGDGATPEIIDKFNDAIEKAWSGQFGEYNVETKVTTPTKENASMTNLQVNWDYLLSGGNK